MGLQAVTTRVLDELVLSIGPAAAFPPRPADLGQRPGRPPLEVHGRTVTFQVPAAVSNALAATARRLASRSRLAHRLLLLQLSDSITHDRPMPSSRAALALALLAQDRLTVASRATGTDQEAAWAVGAELTVAALELVSLPR
jgi:hypothetical protein